MGVFERLRRAMEAAQADQELPDYLAREIAAILDRQEEFARREAALEELVEKVTLYDTYGQTGYLGMGVNNVILQKALHRLLRP
jgi:uncharacterized protein (DUF3084 family)